MSTTDATLVAAVIAALAAIAGTVVSGATAARTRAEARRQQWWGRFTWAFEKALSSDNDVAELGTTVMTRLLLMDWATAADNEMAYAIAEQLTDRMQQARAGEERVDG